MGGKRQKTSSPPSRSRTTDGLAAADKAIEIARVLRTINIISQTRLGTSSLLLPLTQSLSINTSPECLPFLSLGSALSLTGKRPIAAQIHFGCTTKRLLCPRRRMS